MTRAKLPPDTQTVINLWRHFAFDEPLIGQPMTREQFAAALQFEPIAREVAAAGYTLDDAWAYAQHEWAIELVGIA